MIKEEKERLRKEYTTLKGIYKLLKADMKSTEPGSQEMYEIRQDISIVGGQISDVRNRLISATFARINPIKLLDEFLIDGHYDDEPKIGGR